MHSDEYPYGRAIPLTERAHAEFTRRYESHRHDGQRVLDALPRPQLHMGFGRPILEDMDIRFVLCYHFPRDGQRSVNVDVRFGRPDGEYAWVNDNVTAERLLEVVSVTADEIAAFDKDDHYQGVLTGEHVFDLKHANVLTPVNIEAILAHAYRTQLSMKCLVVV